MATRPVMFGYQNLSVQSENPASGTWVYGSASGTSNVTTDPLGGATGGKVTEAVGASGSGHLATVAVAQNQKSTYTASVYLKAAERTFAALGANQGAILQWVNLTNGTLGTLTSTSDYITSSITDAGNGWWRCAVSYTANGGSNTRIYTASANGVISYTGDGTSGIYLWGNQINAEQFISPYAKTTTVVVGGASRPPILAARTPAGTRTVATGRTVV